MDFIGKYLEQELDTYDFAKRLARQPFAMRKDIEAIGNIVPKRQALFSKTIDPFLKQSDDRFLENTDLRFLYRSSGLRTQIFFQIAVKQITDDLRTKAERETGKKVQSDPMTARLAAQETVMRRNEGLIDIARNRDLMQVLGALSPKLAGRVIEYRERHEMLPQFIGGHAEQIKSVVYAPYKQLGVEIDKLTERRLKVRVSVFQKAHELATHNSDVLLRRLDAAFVRRDNPNSRPQGGQPK